MRQFTVRIKEEAFTALLDLAWRERRPPRDQAAWLLESTLKTLAGQQTPDQLRRLVDSREVAPA